MMENSGKNINMVGKAFLVLMGIFLVFLPIFAGAETATKKKIKIGVIGPMKFTVGKHHDWGTQMAADEINAAGGVLVKRVRHNIELIIVDDNDIFSVTDAVNAMERLITISKVDFVIGGFRSESVIAQQEVIADHRVIFMGTASGASELTRRVAKNYDRYKYYFRVMCLNSMQEGRLYMASTYPVLRKIKSELGIDKPRVALLIEKALWTEGIAKLAREAFPQMGGELVGEWRPSYTATDVTAELSAIKAAGAHMIFQTNAGPAGNVIARQWGALQIPAALAGVSAEGQTDPHWNATSGMCNYEAVADHLIRIKLTDLTIPFFDKFTKRFGERPTYGSAGCYDTLFILKKAIERAGTLDNDAVVVELEKTDHIGVLGRIVFTPPNHEFPHETIWGPGYHTGVGWQWRDGDRVVYFPDGRALPPSIGAPPGWENVRYKGTVDYQVPPWVIKYWKSKK